MIFLWSLQYLMHLFFFCFHLFDLFRIKVHFFGFNCMWLELKWINSIFLCNIWIFVVMEVYSRIEHNLTRQFFMSCNFCLFNLLENLCQIVVKLISKFNRQAMHKVFSCLTKALCVIGRGCSSLETFDMRWVITQSFVGIFISIVVFFKFDIALCSVTVNYSPHCVVWFGNLGDTSCVAIDSFFKF